MIATKPSPRIDSNAPARLTQASLATLFVTLFFGLSILGRDQTGGRLDKALEGWHEHVDRFGLPGAATEPTNSAEAPAKKDGKNSGASDDRAEPTPEESRKFDDYLTDIQRRFAMAKSAKAVGHIAIDLLEPINVKAPWMRESHRVAVRPTLPFFQKREYRILVVVWATMPSTSAWSRAHQQAQGIAAELIDYHGSHPRADVQVIAQPWPHGDQPRPAFTVIVTKLKA